MKISVKHLKLMINEALEDGFIQLPEDEMRQLISAMDPEQVATKNYYDSETGEVYLERGETAGSSRLHPQGESDRAAKRAEKEARETEKWAIEDAETAAYDAEQERLRDGGAATASASFDAALEEFLSNWENDSTLEPGVEHDAAETFFDAYPEAEDWADAMGMSRESMLSSVMDHLASLSG